MTTISRAKHALRGQLMDTRDKLAVQGGISASEAAAKNALEYLLPLGKGTIVALYWPLQNEIDPRMLLADLERRGISIALPVVITPDSPLEFRHYATGDDLERGVFNTRHPMPDAPVVEPDIIIVPGLGFDRKGYRIGYGGGFYDRTIAKYEDARAIGFAFSDQIIDDIPRAEHDRQLEAIVTNLSVIRN